MVGGGQQEPARRPLVNFLKENRYQPLELSDFADVIAPLCHCIKLIQQKHAVVLAGKVQNCSQVAPRSSKERAHDSGKVQYGERPPQFACNPLGGKRLPHSRWTGEEDGPSRVNSCLSKPLMFLPLADDLLQIGPGVGSIYRFSLKDWCLENPY